MLCQNIKSEEDFDKPRWKKHIKFLDAIMDNLKLGGIDQDSDIFTTFVARIVLACSQNRERREELLFPIAAACHFMVHGKLPDYVDWTGSQEKLQELYAGGTP
jgi:hypothetical protein